MPDDFGRLKAQELRYSGTQVLIFLFLAVTAFFSDVLFTSRTYYIKDLYRYHVAMKRIIAEVLRSGTIPQWSPFFGGGQPLAANPAWELFYPPQWLLLLPDFKLAFHLHILVHVYLCIAGMYLLLRSLECGKASAALGAIAFALGGPVASLVRLLPFLFEVAWLPVVLLYARRWLIDRNRRDLLLAGLFGGMQALVGEPTTIVQTWGLVAAYAMYRAWRARDVKVLRNGMLGILAMGSLAFAIGAAQMTPAIDFSRDSIRSRAIPFDIVSFSSMPVIRPLELLYPSILQSVSSNGRPWVARLYPNGEPFLATLYPGIAIAVFFLAGILARRRGWQFVLAVTCGAYVLAIGVHTPLLELLYRLGIFRAVRYPEKFALSLVFVIVVWGAMSFDRLVEGDRDVLRWSLRVVAIWAVAGLFLMATHGGPNAVRRHEEQPRG